MKTNLSDNGIQRIEISKVCGNKEKTYTLNCVCKTVGFYEIGKRFRTLNFY